MSNRHYQTTHTVAKFLEVASWVLLGVGIIAGIYFLSQETMVGIAIIAVSIIYGITMVVFAQFMLVIVDMENNTRQVAEEAMKTNAMLAETLGTISANLNKIAQKENES